MFERCPAETADGDRRPPGWFLGAILLLTLLAFALRLPGLTWGTPVVWAYNSDNERFVEDALRIAANGDLNPHWFGHPGSTVIYPLAGTFALTQWLDRTMGGSFLPLAEILTRNPAPFYAIGRVFTALLGAAVIPITYRLGQRAAGPFAGLVAACILTVSPLHVLLSHMARTDVVGTFWSSLGLLACTFILRQARWPYYLVAGLAFGLAISSKYNLVVLAPALVLAHGARLARCRRSGGEILPLLSGAKLLVGLTLIGVTFALASPFVLLDFPTAMKDLVFERRTVNLSADGLNAWQNGWWYLTVVIPGGRTWPNAGVDPSGGLGPIGAILAGAGTLVALRRKNRYLLGCLAVFLVFLVGISVQALHWPRWILPVLPLLAVLAGTGLDGVTQTLNRWGRLPNWARTAVVILILAAGLAPLGGVVRYNLDRTLPTTRQQAQAWVEENLPAEARVISENYAIPATPGRFSRFDYVYALGREPIEEIEQYDYVVISQKMVDRYRAEQERYGDILDRYEQIDVEMALIKAVEPEPCRVAGPAIYVYQVRRPGA